MSRKNHKIIDGRLLQTDKKYSNLKMGQNEKMIHIEPLTYSFSVCKVADYSMVDPSAAFCFPQKTDTENSLVCLTEQVPDNVTNREDGWKAFRIKGQMEFSLIGILSGISTVLAGKAIGIFAISTFDTDYILVKQDDFEKAIDALDHAGYTVERNLTNGLSLG